MSLREESLNVMLAELLTERGLKALGEVVLRRRDGRPEPDVLIELNGVRIVIEGKKGGMWEVLVKQCENRLDNNVCDICVMVEYADIKLDSKILPDQLDVKNALLKGRFNVGFMSYVDRAGLQKWVGIPSKPEEYKNVGFDELLTYLMSVYGRVVREDVIGPVIKRMDDVLSQFATQLSSAVNVERLKKVLEVREVKKKSDE